jgi:soluble epoxide hydrolase / lipid-phosphate phosphatase
MKASPPPEDFLKSKTSFLDAWKDYEEIPPVPFLDKDEEDYLVESYERSEFDNSVY